MLKSADPMLDAVTQRVRKAGLRVTGARVRVLAVLIESGRLMSHHDIERELGGRRIDRVTLYRVLDTLAEQGLAHRAAGGDRVWRFGVASDAAQEAHHRHAHFQCNQCGRVVCLREVGTERPRLRVPRGYRPEAIELTVKGRCPQCVPQAGRTP